MRSSESWPHQRRAATLTPMKHRAHRPSVSLSLWICLVTLGACSGPEPASEETAETPLAGTWRAVLESPGGELPFGLRITDSGGELAAVALNGEEEAPFSSVERNGDEVVLHFSWYDSEITARIDDDRLTGTWRKTAPGQDSSLPFSATRDETARFLPEASSGETGGSSDIGGVWAVEFSDEDGTEPARGEFVQVGERVEGTFLTPTGDYRFLEGSFGNGRLRLSTFDGAHAFLFVAETLEDGSLRGDFWSRDTYHATWTARRHEGEEAILPNSWELVGLTNDEGSFRFSFPDLDGQTVSLEDPRFDDKVVLVNVFGSWCPNCNDEAPFLAEWARRYKERGLEVVGLAYEFSGDPDRDREMVRRYGDRFGIEFPLLLAGTSDKQAAGETLPDLTSVVAFPTSIFIDRQGKVRRIHSGFNGPGTGDHHEQLLAELEGLIEELLEEEPA